MRHSVRTLVLSCAIAALSTPADAQTCMGFPSFATGPLNLSAAGRVGGRFWGSAADMNVGRRTGGPFANLGFSTVTYVDDPKETRYVYGTAVGYVFNRRDQLIACPIITYASERGRAVEYEPGLRSTTNGTIWAGGIGLAGEQNRGRFSVAPFIVVRYAQIDAEVTGDSTFTETDHGFLGSAGLAFRWSDALQVAPLFSFGTFPQQDMVFHLRLSIALQFRR
jgi:hypothetical protein